MAQKLLLDTVLKKTKSKNKNEAFKALRNKGKEARYSGKEKAFYIYKFNFNLFTGNFLK